MNPLRAPFAVGAFLVRQVGGVCAQVLRAVVEPGHPGHERPHPDDRVSAMPLNRDAPPGRPAPPAPPASPAPPPPPPPPAPPASAPPQPPSTRVAQVGDPGEPGPEVHVEGEPWPGYEALRAPEIIARLEESDASTRATVRLYEQSHKHRKTVLRATER